MLKLTSSIEQDFIYGIIHLVRAQIFPENFYFVSPDTHSYVRVSRVKNIFSKMLRMY